MPKLVKLDFGAETRKLTNFSKMGTRYYDVECPFCGRRSSAYFRNFSAGFRFVPTKKEMAAILVIPRIANSETVADIGEGVKTLAVEWLEELRPAAKNGETK